MFFRMVENCIADRCFGDISGGRDPPDDVQTKGLGGEETPVHPDDPGQSNGKNRRQGQNW